MRPTLYYEYEINKFNIIYQFIRRTLWLSERLTNIIKRKWYKKNYDGLVPWATELKV